jgi:hypothetical protein
VDSNQTKQAPFTTGPLSHARKYRSGKKTKHDLDLKKALKNQALEIRYRYDFFKTKYASKWRVL